MSYSQSLICPKSFLKETDLLTATFFSFHMTLGNLLLLIRPPSKLLKDNQSIGWPKAFNDP